MITPHRSSSVRFTLLAGSCALVLAAYSAVPLFAATPPPDPVPAVSLVVNKTSETSTTKAPSAASASRNNSSTVNGRTNPMTMGRPTQQNQSSSASSNVTYTITVRNTGKIPAKNLVVEYHFYNKTTTTDNGKSTYSVEDITSTENVDVDPAKTKDIETQAITHASSMSSSSGNSNNSGGGGRRNVGATQSSGGGSSSTTALLGWHVEVRFNDKIIRQVNQPDNLQDLLKQYK